MITVNESLLQHLNEAQREAVTSESPYVLVLAGAGSGKTRVLAYRVAYIVQAYQISTNSILAVTFTNKAAREMRARIEGLLGFSVGNMWIGTFHGLSHRLLRLHWREAGLNQAFQILDSEDQRRLIRRLIRQLNLDESRWPPQKAQWFINAQKQAGRRARHITDTSDYFVRVMLQVYQAYEAACEQNHLVDFSELLLRAYELLRDHTELLAHYQARFQHILVDEFQDTNHMQYRWLCLLAGQSARVMIVGDDDQSIYGWRGAEVANLQHFQKDFPSTTLIRLQRNYRSTPTILKAANAVIEHNKNRLGKALWTESNQGPSISLYTAFNEMDEANFIKAQIREWLDQNYSGNGIAILYRANAQSRVLEEVLSRANIPYRVYGGLRFFERAEIKDALAYLRLAVNPQDDAAFERIINTPTRGIGQTTLNRVREVAREEGIALWEAGQRAITHNLFSGRAAKALSSFYQLIGQLAEQLQPLPLPEQVSYMLSVSGLWDHYKTDKTERGQAKLENLEELVSAARQFMQESDSYTESPLTEFLASAALEAGENQGDVTEHCVNLMTLHAAKGLEFSIVFLCGLEEGLFPLYRSLDDPNALEEERRLCYVGMTRAKYKLYLTHAEVRRLRGRETYQRPSRFIKEIPDDCLEVVRPYKQVSRPVTRRDDREPREAIDIGSYHVGDRVYHPSFGEGTIINYEGKGASLRIQVRFNRLGTKWLVAQYAPLEKR